MYFMSSLDNQLKTLIEDCKRLLKDMDHYHDVPSSTYFQNVINKKIQQLQGLLIMVEGAAASQDYETPEEVFRTIKSEIYVTAKKWKLAVESRYRHQKLRFGKLFYMSSIG